MYLILLLIGAIALNSYGEAAHIHSEIPNLRVVGGQEATPHSAPYMVYLQPKSANNSEGTCGGTILSENYFMTAAHCLYQKTGWLALFGAHDVTNKTNPHLAIRFDGTYKIHPNYTPTTSANDIAIAKIPTGLDFNKYIQPVKLPSRKDVNNTYVGQTVKTYGWGNVAPKKLSNVLMTVNFKVSPQTDCKALNKPITNKQLCTFGGVGKSACKGDSGGPVMLGNVQVGLLSLGDPTCASTSNKPGIATKIDQYLDWIKANSDVVIN